MKNFFLCALLSLVASPAFATRDVKSKSDGSTSAAPIEKNGRVIGARLSTVLQPIASASGLRITLVSTDLQVCRGRKPGCEVALLSTVETIQKPTQVMFDLIYGAGNSLGGGENVSFSACAASRCEPSARTITLPK